MTVTREELHEMVDRLDAGDVDAAGELLGQFSGDEQLPRRRPSWIGQLHSSSDLAERSEDILRDEFHRSQ